MNRITINILLIGLIVGSFVLGNFVGFKSCVTSVTQAPISMLEQLIK